MYRRLLALLLFPILSHAQSTGDFRGSFYNGTAYQNFNLTAPGLVYMTTSVPPTSLQLGTDFTITSGTLSLNAASAFREQALTVTSGTVPFNVNNGVQGTFTVTGNTTVTVSNARAGMITTLIVTQNSGASPYTLTFPVGTLSRFGGTNTYQMSGTAVRDVIYLGATGATPTLLIMGANTGFTP